MIFGQTERIRNQRLVHQWDNQMLLNNSIFELIHQMRDKTSQLRIEFFFFFFWSVSYCCDLLLLQWQFFSFVNKHHLMENCSKYNQKLVHLFLFYILHYNNNERQQNWMHLNVYILKIFERWQTASSSIHIFQLKDRKRENWLILFIYFIKQDSIMKKMNWAIIIGIGFQLANEIDNWQQLVMNTTRELVFRWHERPPLSLSPHSPSLNHDQSILNGKPDLKGKNVSVKIVCVIAIGKWLGCKYWFDSHLPKSYSNVIPKIAEYSCLYSCSSRLITTRTILDRLKCSFAAFRSGAC